MNSQSNLKCFSKLSLTFICCVAFINFMRMNILWTMSKIWIFEQFKFYLHNLLIINVYLLCSGLLILINIKLTVKALHISCICNYFKYNIKYNIKLLNSINYITVKCFSNLFNFCIVVIFEMIFIVSWYLWNNVNCVM